MMRPSAFKLLGLLLICALSVSALSAQGLDVTLDTSASVSKIADTSVSLSQGVNLSFGLPLGAAAKFTVKGGLSLGLNYTSVGPSTTVAFPKALGDIDLQELSYAFGAPLPEEGLSQFNFSFGRISFADPSGAVYAYRLDGLSLKAGYPLVAFVATLGYTGYLPGAAPLLTSPADSFYGSGGFAPPRALAAVSILPPKLAEHELYLTFLAQEDFRNDTQLIPEYEKNFDSTGSGPADSSYMAFGVSGPAASAIGYSAYGVYQFGRRLSYVADTASNTGYRYLFKPVNAFSFGASFRMPLTSRLNLSARFQYGSGDADAPNGSGGNTAGDSTFFMPVTRSSSGLVFSPQAGNVTLLNGTITAKVFPGVTFGPKSVSLIGGTFIYIKNGEGPISEAGVDPKAGLSLLGFEQDVTASVRLLSDCTANLSIGAFAPFAAPSGAFDPSFAATAPLQFIIRAGLSIAL